jgi:RNA polymerase nonessential primary-like sigma factor
VFIIKGQERLTADQEKEIARRIIAFEQSVLEMLQRSPLSEVEGVLAVLEKRSTAKERTRAGSVKRTRQALVLAQDASRRRRSLQRATGKATVAWVEVESLCWRLAMSGRRIAHGEAQKLAGPFLDEEDLVQEGYIGLMRAAKRFDPDRDIRFSTYARWWVRAQMTRAIDNDGRQMRIPGCASEQLRKIRKVIRNMGASGVTPSVDDLALELNLKPARVRLLLSLNSRVISLDEPIDAGPRARTLEHFLHAGNQDLDEFTSTRGELIKMMEAVGRLLTDRHRYVLIRRYGLEGHKPQTLVEVGKGMKLSRERVRQIEREALVRLRDKGRIRK